MEPLSLFLASQLTRAAALGALASDPVVADRREPRRRLPGLRRPALARQSGVRRAFSFAFSSGGIDSEHAFRTNCLSVSSKR